MPGLLRTPNLSHFKNLKGPMFPNLIDWSDKPGSAADSVPDQKMVAGKVLMTVAAQGTSGTEDLISNFETN